MKREWVISIQQQCRQAESHSSSNNGVASARPRQGDTLTGASPESQSGRKVTPGRADDPRGELPVSVWLLGLCIYRKASSEGTFVESSKHRAQVTDAAHQYDQCNKHERGTSQYEIRGPKVIPILHEE